MGRGQHRRSYLGADRPVECLARVGRLMQQRGHHMRLKSWCYQPEKLLTNQLLLDEAPVYGR